MNRCLALGLNLVWAAGELLDFPARADYDRVAATALLELLIEQYRKAATS